MTTPSRDSVVIVTRRTELEELVSRFNTEAQARFYLEHAGQPFGPIRDAHTRQQDVLADVRRGIPETCKQQLLSREDLPRYVFAESDLVVVIGQDGLVSNTAKYLSGQPIVAINPDPDRYDGVLLPFSSRDAARHVHLALRGDAAVRQITMALARLSDGQTLLAFNDFFVGARSHVSARYRIQVGERYEEQSSSGVIVSTGAGSTGWLQSVYAGARGVVEALGGTVIPPENDGRLSWDADRLVYSVREPFPSRATETSIVHGIVDSSRPLRITSRMATNGVIFSDGVEADFLNFNTGAELTIKTAPSKASLVVPGTGALH